MYVSMLFQAVDLISHCCVDILRSSVGNLIASAQVHDCTIARQCVSVTIVMLLFSSTTCLMLNGC